MNREYREIVKIQRDYLSKVEELLLEVTKKNYKKFSSVNELIDHLKTFAASAKSGNQFGRSISKIYSDLQSFYNENAANWFKLATNLGGLKLVFGGISRFSETLLRNARNVLIFSDTIFLADPVLPWIESEREHENFQVVQLLKNMYFVLQLKDIVDADLEYPPIILFPSFEKSFEENDEITKTGIDNLISDFFSYYLNEKFYHPSETLDYAREKSELFLKKIEEKQLFWPAQAESITNLNQGILDYKEFIKKNRSINQIETAERMLPSELVWMGICERITPHFHLLENSYEFGANPTFSKKAHWYYHTLLSKMHNSFQSKNQKATSISNSLNDFRMNWLNNISVQDIILLRKNNENEKFRKDLLTQIDILDETLIENYDKVTNEVIKIISGLMANYNKEIEEIKERYQLKYKHLLGATVVSTAAQFYPAFREYTEAVPPIISALKYSYDKMEEKYSLRKQRKSIIGLFSQAMDEN